MSRVRHKCKCVRTCGSDTLEKDEKDAKEKKEERGEEEEEEARLAHLLAGHWRCVVCCSHGHSTHKIKVVKTRSVSLPFVQVASCHGLHFLLTAVSQVSGSESHTRAACFVPILEFLTRQRTTTQKDIRLLV